MKYIDFEDDKQAKITLYLPEIHCSSCNHDPSFHVHK